MQVRDVAVVLTGDRVHYEQFRDVRFPDCLFLDCEDNLYKYGETSKLDKPSVSNLQSWMCTILHTEPAHNLRTCI